MQVVGFYVKFCPEQYDIIDFNFFFTVANEECFTQKARLLVHDLRRHQVVVVAALLGCLGCFLLLVVRHVAAVGLRVLNLDACVGGSCGHPVACLSLRCTGCAALIVLIGLTASGGSRGFWLEKWLFFLGVNPKARVVNALEE